MNFSQVEQIFVFCVYKNHFDRDVSIEHVAITLNVVALLLKN